MIKCQAENYVKVGGQQVGELETCDAPGQLVEVKGLLLGVHVHLCGEHQRYFTHRGYLVQIVREKRERMHA